MKILNRMISSAVMTYSLFSETLQLRYHRKQAEKVYLSLREDLSDLGKVSIILPTYNRAEILFQRAIPSILSQSYLNWELLVISHGCTDETDKKVRNLAALDNRVRLVSIERKRLGYPSTAENHWLVGPVKPINAGLAKVSGLWIARIDDDDEWQHNHLEQSLRALIKSRAEFISSSYQVIDSDGTKIVTPSGSPRIGGVQTWLYRSYLAFFRAHLSCWRKSWNRVNDTDIQERMIRAGVKTMFYDQVTVTIRPRPGEKFVGSKAYLTNSKAYDEKYGNSSRP